MSNNDAWDFGFTATTVEELDAIQQSKSQHQEETNILSDQIEKQKATNAMIAASNANNLEKLEKLYNAILPLLTNLEKDADTREYLYWPGRAEKIEEFRQHLKSIKEGDS